MKNTLQYTYTIFVFVGVLITAYAMMSRDLARPVEARSVTAPSFRSDAQFVDPAVSRLFQVETELTALGQEAPKRLPTARSAPAIR